MATTSFEFPTQIDLVHFVSQYAHDLRSPFNRTMGFLKIVLKEQDGPLTDMQKEDLNTVYQNNVSAFIHISNLIDIARLMAGEKNLNLTTNAVEPLLNQAINQWEKYHAGTNSQVQFVSHIPEDIAPVQVDGVLLAQAITGLIACVVESRKRPVEVSLTVAESSAGVVITIHGRGQPAFNPSTLDLDAYGFISQAFITLHSGKFIRQENGDDEAVIVFVLPEN